MAKNWFHAQLQARIDEAIDKMAGSIASGVCNNQEQYREKCGYINGLKAAGEIADDIEKENE